MTEEQKRRQAEIEYKLMLLKIRREEEEKRRQKRAWFDLLFPEFKDVPIVWVVIGIICVLFSLFTLIV